MIIPIAEARETLRLDGDDNDAAIKSLLDAIPSYLQEVAGYTFDGKASPLAQTTAKFILRLWYDPDGHDTDRIKRTIDCLLVALTATVRNG